MEDAGEMWIQSWRGVRFLGEVDLVWDRCKVWEEDAGEMWIQSWRGLRFLGEVDLVWERYKVWERWKCRGDVDLVLERCNCRGGRAG